MLNIITGRTGSGKTRYIRNLATEIAKNEIIELGFEPISPLDLNAIGEEELKNHPLENDTWV